MKKISKRKAEKIVNKRIKKCVQEIYDYESSFNEKFQYTDIYRFLRGEIFSSAFTTKSECIEITDMLEIKKRINEEDYVSTEILPISRRDNKKALYVF